jgi:hypothetical protein
LELKQLKSSGFTWNDDFAQCVVQAALNTIRYK